LGLFVELIKNKLQNFKSMEKNYFKGFLTFLFFTMFIVISLGSQAQTEVSGKVTDQTGESVPGVTIAIKGTTQGTITDMDGMYQISVPDGATLLFSYIGMLTQSIEVVNQTTIDVKLSPDVIGVDEVVVVGYGTRVKEELTGAVSTVSTDELQVSTEASVVSRLQGHVSGVTVTSSNRPGGNATIRIRGVGTINDPNPLYIIDGVPTTPGNNISPGDIESISILKDASSAAIYGTRGANGVVIITTKRGRVNQQPTIKFSARAGVSNAINQYDLLNTKEYADAVWLSYANRGAAPIHAQYGSGSTPVIPDYILPGGASEGDAATDPALYSYPDYVIFKANKEGTNWYDEIYQSGVVQEYDLSVSGGGKNGTYAFSGNYLDEDGILKNTNFKRYTFRMNSDAKFNDWLKVGESLQTVYTDQHGNLGDDGEGTVISNAYRTQPIIPVYDIKGNYAGTKAPEMGNASNPLAMLDRAKNNNGKWVRILGNIYGEITLFKGLTAKSLLGYNYGQWNSKSYVLPTYEDSEPNKVNGLNVSSNYSLQWNWSNTLNYNTTFNEIHKLNVIVGTESIDNKWQSLNASRRQYFAETPEYMQLNSGESNKENSGTGSEWSLFSIFGRVNYDLNGKYFLEATVRRDGSSRFSEANRYGTFPAASAAWAISEESFMQNTENWLDLLKVRLGWGIAGNDRIGNYNSYSTYGTHTYKASYALDGSNSSAVSGFRPSTLGNEDVTWETTQTINFGIDANMLDNHLAVSLDIWKRNTSNMLFREPIPQVMGVATAPYVNIGEMQNKGFDIEVGYNNATSDGKFTYAANLTLSHYKNEIIKLSGDPDRTIDAGSNRQMTYTRYANGTAFPEFYGYVVEGIFQTDAEANSHPQYGSTNYNQPGHFKFKDQLTVDTDGDGIPDKADGVITPDDRTFIGSPHPDFTGGLNIDLGYGSFDFNMFFYGSYGNEMVNYVTRWIDYGMFNGGLSKDALYNSWGSPHLANNADAKLPMLDQSDISQQPSTAFVEDASYLRLKTMRLGYTLPKNILEKVQIKSVRVYAQVTNVFTITGYSGLDPEYNTSGSGMGLDRGAWPTPRQIMFGVNLGL
jgi:TonB-linked SusC/RagA family outer membrane protein